MKKSWKVSSWHRQICHSGPVEVIDNLLCGSMREADAMVLSHQADVLVPLESLDGGIWNLGFRGEILYYPIPDFGTLPTDVLEELVSRVLLRLRQKKRVGIFCFGGHGRTGYVTAVILGKLGIDDPIRFLRKHYCEKAIESNAQIEHIGKVLNKPELAKRYISRNRFGNLFDIFPDTWWGYGAETVSLLGTDSPACGECSRCRDGFCEVYHTPVDTDEIACENFSKNVRLP